jgi:SAM-dependent methyltransferase
MNRFILHALKTASKPIPRPIVYRLAHHLAKRDYERLVRRRLGPYFRPVDEGPPAPREVLLTTKAMNEQELSEALLADRFFSGAYKTVHSWLQLLEAHGVNLRTVGSILEIGCGSARLLRHFRCFDGTRIVGCDADPKAIEWCKQNIPGAEFYVNQLQPPLALADDSFDFILAASVFTHIPLDVQKPWLLELRRIMRPGSIFLCTIEGWFNQRRQLTQADRETLRRVGHVTLDKDSPNASLATKSLPSWDVFQRRDQVIQEYGSVFRILDYFPDKQDLLVLQKAR